MNVLRAASRIFTADKVVQNRLLNVLGAQVVRSVVARAMHLSRQTVVDHSLSERCNALERDGILVWEDFLPVSTFQDLEKECHRLLREESQFVARQSGPNTSRKAMVSSLSPAASTALRQFLLDQRLRALLQAAERRPLRDLLDVAELEELIQGQATSVDPQSQPHSDIFFASHKVWFYLTDVDRAAGPFAFIPGSHRLSATRLLHVYSHSVRLGDGVDPSRRIGHDEMEVLGPHERIMTVPRNTLVVANTCGYHRRLQGEPGRRRLSIHIELRSDPFRGGPTS